LISDYGLMTTSEQHHSIENDRVSLRQKRCARDDIAREGDMADTEISKLEQQLFELTTKLNELRKTNGGGEYIREQTLMEGTENIHRSMPTGNGPKKGRTVARTCWTKADTHVRRPNQ